MAHEFIAAFGAERDRIRERIGQVKAKGFRQFLMRGLDKVAHEWGLVCLAHNMLKLAQGRSPSAAEFATP
jgi:Transposase DDE domain